MSKPIEQIAALTIGTVESVSPSEIRVLLEPNAPQATALNTGIPTGFPRINGYVLIPNEFGAVVGLVVWLGVERSQFPKRTGLKDFGLIDLPFPLRKIYLTPLGTLLAGRSGTGQRAYSLERGVSAFPSVGDVAQLPTADQLRCIIEASSETDRRVRIGTSPLAANATVTVDPDKIFGRHLAVLGNTGSGKSCSVAGIIRWSLEKAKDQRAEDAGLPNARFIILDPNGEYSSAFADHPDVRLFKVPPAINPYRSLILPGWMWNSYEWCAFTEASSKVQKPILMRALRELRVIGEGEKDDTEAIIPIRLRLFYRSLIKDKSQGPTAYMDFPGKQNFGQKINAIASSVGVLSTKYPKYNSCLVALLAELNAVLTSKLADSRGFYPAFDDADIDKLISAFDTAIKALPMPTERLSVNEDSPVKFNVADLADIVEQIAIEQGQLQFVDTLLLRIKMLLSDERLKAVVSPETDDDISSWLESAIGQSSNKTGCISILDLSLLSSDIIHTIIAVVARIIFEATQRYRKLNNNELPTVLVLEEAHTFVKRGGEDSDTPTPTQMCRMTFERIAREGRKFGLGLVLSSQRPSELSPTVLAQCNTFLLHRIVNDRDQELVGKLVPDNLGGLLKELPSLPSRQAILLGWAATVPTLVEITELPEKQRPQSSDPKFWDVWVGKEERHINWEEIVKDWTGNATKTDQPISPDTQESRSEDDSQGM